MEFTFKDVTDDAMKLLNLWQIYIQHFSTKFLYNLEKE